LDGPRRFDYARPALVRTDEQLMAAYAAGDRTAFAELFERYAPLIGRVIRRGISRPEVARELVQETFLQVHRARADYDPSRPLRPWLTTVAMNVRRDYLRRIQRRPEGALSDHAEMEHAADDASPLATVEATRVREVVAQLPDNQRAVIELHWFEGLGFPEVADVLGVKPSAVKVRAHRAYKRLRDLLAEKKRVTVGTKASNTQ